MGRAYLNLKISFQLFFVNSAYTSQNDVHFDSEHRDIINLQIGLHHVNKNIFIF